jgi:hypothetical protein
MTKNQVIETLKIADAGLGIRHVFVRDLELTCIIGVHAHEKRGPQRIRINLDVGVLESEAPHEDQLENVLCYEDLVVRIRASAWRKYACSIPWLRRPGCVSKNSTCSRMPLVSASRSSAMPRHGRGRAKGQISAILQLCERCSGRTT